MLEAQTNPENSTPLRDYTQLSKEDAAYMVYMYEKGKNTPVVMDKYIAERLKTMTMSDLLKNLVNDIQEDGDSGFSPNMTVHQYFVNLFED